MTGDPLPDTLRDVRFETGHALRTWDTGRTGTDARASGHELRDPAGDVLFRGADFRPSPMHADDADETLRGLLGFLTLRPGDTDRSNFAEYSERQRAFSESSECDASRSSTPTTARGTFTDADGDSEGAHHDALARRMARAHGRCVAPDVCPAWPPAAGTHPGFVRLAKPFGVVRQGEADREAWSHRCSADGAHETFLSPVLADPVEVGAVLVHGSCTMPSVSKQGTRASSARWPWPSGSPAPCVPRRPARHSASVYTPSPNRSAHTRTRPYPVVPAGRSRAPACSR